MDWEAIDLSPQLRYQSKARLSGARDLFCRTFRKLEIKSYADKKATFVTHPEELKASDGSLAKINSAELMPPSWLLRMAVLASTLEHLTQ